MEPSPELNASILEPLTLDILQPLNVTIPTADEVYDLLNSENPLQIASDYLSDECTGLLQRLNEAVLRRVGYNSYHCQECSSAKPCDRAHISIMFSGGIDSMMLAHLADGCVPCDQSIDLLNVAFEVGNSGSYDVPDRVTGRQALAELSSDRKWNFVEVGALTLASRLSCC